MNPTTLAALTLLIFAAAILYSSVGHAGASGYLASMALFSLAPPVMRPTALVLNILVALVASTKFYRAGHFVWRLFWPFALTSVPLAYLGGRIALPNVYYKYLVGAVLLFSAYRLLKNPNVGNEPSQQTPALWLMLVMGGVLGLLSGLTGVGGGIFLSPLLLFMGWAEMRQASGVAAVFILVNSISGLLGLLSRAPVLPSQIYFWAVAAVLGGFIGAEYGSRRIAGANLKRLLAVVLIIAGIKMILT
ncbi:MAG: sulfite exporter TauE/SafE family protein [Acidobacteriota bacterium]